MSLAELCAWHGRHRSSLRRFVARRPESINLTTLGFERLERFMSLDRQRQNFINKLSLHQYSAVAYITLSTLVGGAAATQLLWTKWASRNDQYTTVCTYGSLRSLFEASLFSALSSVRFAGSSISASSTAS